MKALLACLITFVALPAFPQAIWRNFFTTNQNPLVTVVAGSNATVQASTVGVNQRIFTVNAVPGNAVFVTTAILTNQVYASNVLGAVAESTHSTNADNATYITTATITNQVYGTNVVGYVSEASHATNADNAMYGTNATYVLTATITNKIYASNIVSGGQAPAGTIEANVGWDGAFLQFSNSSRVWGANADQLTNTTGFSVSQMADTNWINQQIANIGLTLYTTGTTNAGALDGRTNNWQAWNAPIATPVTNTITWDATDPPVNAYLRQLVSTNTFSNIKAGPISVKCYFIRTGGGTLELHPEFYLFDTVEGTLFYEAASAVKQTIAATATPVAYTWTISSTALTHTNPVKYVVAWKLDTKPNNGSTLSFVAGGSYDSHASFVISLAGSTINANQVVGAGNLIYSNAATARIDMATNAAYATNLAGWLPENSVNRTNLMVNSVAQTNILENSVARTNLMTDSVATTNIVADARIHMATNASYATNWTMITNTAAEQNIPVATSASSAAWVPGWTNAVMWNAAGTHYFTNNANGWGVDLGPAANDEFSVNGDIRAAANMYAGSSVRAGNSSFQAGTRTIIRSPADLSLVVTDFAERRDRLYLNGPVKSLTDAAAVSIAQINVFTNAAAKSAFVGGIVDYTINCIDAEGGENQALSGIVTFSACNTNGVFYNAVATEVAANQAKSVTSGTLTTSWALTPKTSYESTNILLQVTADTSLTPAANKFYILWQLRSNGTNTVTAL